MAQSSKEKVIVIPQTKVHGDISDETALRSRIVNTPGGGTILQLWRAQPRRDEVGFLGYQLAPIELRALLDAYEVIMPDELLIVDRRDSA